MNVYEIVTNRIIQQLEEGTVPWHKPWSSSSGNVPINYVTRKPYRGVNLLLLSMPGEWLTWNQIKKLHGTVRKGETSSLVVFFSFIEPKDKKKSKVPKVDTDIFDSSIAENKKPSDDAYPLLRYTNVWHISQVDGIESKLNLQPVESSLVGDEQADYLINTYCREEHIKLHITNSQSAYYSQLDDSIMLPQLSQYECAAEFYSTAFHELAHSTGHSSRLNRLTSKTETAYAKEELIAEIASSFILSSLEIDVKSAFDNSVAYISSWLSELRNNPKLIVSASGAASKAADYILRYNTRSAKNDT